MHRYFKLVCLSKDPEWLVDEFRSGRVRFGWSGPDSDLHRIAEKDASARSQEERVTWRYSGFLVSRLKSGDRVVVQTEQPLRRFFLGEVVNPGYEFSADQREDFNHILHVSPLLTEPIPINSIAVSASLKHDLTKRGQYYEIYPQSSKAELEGLVVKAKAGQVDMTSVRTDTTTLDQTAQDVRKSIAATLNQRWPSKDFERLCALLCANIDNMEVNDRADTGKGWDLRVRLVNPLTRSVLVDNVPVQCKNFSGSVTDTRPIDDLARCVINSDQEIPLAFLFILGDLTPEFRLALAQRQEQLTEQLGRPVTLEVVDRDRIVELYLAYAAKVASEGGTIEASMVGQS